MHGHKETKNEIRNMYQTHLGFTCGTTMVNEESGVEKIVGASWSLLLTETHLLAGSGDLGKNHPSRTPCVVLHSKLNAQKHNNEDLKQFCYTVRCHRICVVLYRLPGVTYLRIEYINRSRPMRTAECIYLNEALRQYWIWQYWIFQ